jgi:ribosomal protein S18 acetylase RimI-like enzyme
VYVDDLSRIAEGILLDYDPRDHPADIELVERDDLIMWTRPSSVPWMSTVRLARWTDAEAEERIDEVLGFFGSRGRSFVWHVGPSSAPMDLAERLLQRGLELESDTRLLVARLPVRGLRHHRELRVVDAREPEEIKAYLRFARREWSDAEVEKTVGERVATLALYGDRMGNVLGYLGEELVANAAWRDSSDGRAVYLSGAGTLPEHRGKGIYQTLVGYRLERAAQRGCRYAVIQARADTSLPILLRRGFVEVARVPVLMHVVT